MQSGKSTVFRRPQGLQKRAGSLLGSLVVYLLLIEFIFVFLYPFLFMIVNSLKFDADFRDLNRQWVLTGLNLENYKTAFQLLDYSSTVLVNLVVVLVATVGHVFSCSFIAYGVARYSFKGRTLIFVLIILSILVPPVLIQMPLYIQFSRMQWIGTILPIVVPAFFGFGLKGGLYIFIFMQFFRGLPRSYEEAAKIEGCGGVSAYLRIMLPLSKTSILVVSTLSIIWHWNDSFEPTAFLSVGNVKMLTQRLASIPEYLYQSTTASGVVISPVQLAACMLIILPLIIMYGFIQKRFMQGMEFSGLAN